MRLLPPLRLTGATILREGELRHRSVAIEHGRISKGPLPAVDLSGYAILPGIIDLFATLPKPSRPEAALPGPQDAIRDAHAEAAAYGVTTAWLAIDWSWRGGMGDPARALNLLSVMARMPGPVDLRPALRIEASRVDSGPELIMALHRYRPQLAFLENRAATLQAIDTWGEDFIAEATRSGLSPARLADALRQDAQHNHAIPRHLCRIAETLDEIRAHYGSIDDPGGDIRETYSMLGAALAFCPQTFAAAAAGRAMGSPVFITPQQSALQDDLMRTSIATAFVSRGDQAGLARRVLQLSGPDLAELPRFWPLISSRPAQVMGLADRGTLDYGRRADLVILCRKNLRIEATISGGRISYLAAEAAHRFHKADTVSASLPMAAE